MPIRSFRRYLTRPIVLVAAIEAIMLLVLPYVSALVRFNAGLHAAERYVGRLTLRAFVFTLLAMYCMVTIDSTTRISARRPPHSQ